MLNPKSAPFKSILHINYKSIPTTVTSSINEFNELCQFWKHKELTNELVYGIIRTPSGGISTKNKFPAYDVTVDGVGCELLVVAEIDNNPAIYRVQYRTQIKTVNNVRMFGTIAFNRFAAELKRDGIDITSYYIDNGIEIKKEIEKPLIGLTNQSFKDRIFTNVHHLDIRSSYPSGMAECCPEWKPTIERLYSGREEHPEYKEILNLSCGYFQSVKNFGAKLAHISKYAIKRNNERIQKMSKWLTDTNRVVIAYNTDGIWFYGESTNLNSHKLGDFNQDHTNCKIRFKSNGSYEYIENGVYHPVVRGKTKLDEIKDRTSWNWGDIYCKDAQPIELQFDYDEFKIIEVLNDI